MQPLPTPLHSARLTLHATTLAHLAAERAGPAALESALGAVVPASWPPGEYDADALAFFEQALGDGGPAVVGWYGWYAVRRATAETPATLVGAGGFFGPPDADGVVEIGYSICSEWQRQGFATELVATLVAWARSQPAVRGMRAHTTPDNAASIAVLERTGFVADGAGAMPEQLRFGLTWADD